MVFSVRSIRSRALPMPRSSTTLPPPVSLKVKALVLLISSRTLAPSWATWALAPVTLAVIASARSCRLSVEL